MTYQIPSENQRHAVESFRKFLDAEIAPLAREYDDRLIPTERMREITQMIAEFGLPGAAFGAESGGLGLGYVTQAMLFEELMTASVEIGLSVMINCHVAELLSDAPRHLRDRYLPRLLSGRIFGCLGLAKQESADNVDDIRVRAARNGEELIVDGETAWLSNGFYSDFVICSARVGAADLSHILIDRHEHGYEVMNVGKRGANSPSGARIAFAETHAPASNLLSVGGADRSGETQGSDKAKAHGGMLSVSLMRAAVEGALSYARGRNQSGKPIATSQLVAAKLAEMATLVDAARLMCFRVFALIDAGLSCSVEASMAKWFAAEMSVKVCHDAVQLRGDEGSSAAFTVERLTRQAGLVHDGSTEQQKFIISRGLTGLAASQ